MDVYGYEVTTYRYDACGNVDIYKPNSLSWRQSSIVKNLLINGEKLYGLLCSLKAKAFKICFSVRRKNLNNILKSEEKFIF